MRLPKPLGIQSIIANSILDYVLEHPATEPVEAYNDWVQTVAIARFFPMSQHELTLFALNQFDIYIKMCDEDSLRFCQQVENTAAMKMRRPPQPAMC